MNYRSLVICLWLLILSACEETPLAEDYPPQDNYCEEKKRALSDREKISAVFKFAYYEKSRDEWPLKGYKSTTHFETYRAELLKTDNSAEPDIIISKYLDQYPECCAVFQPYYVTSARSSFEWMIDLGLLRDWNRDVVVTTSSDHFKYIDEHKRRFSSRIHVRISACGKVTKIDRG